MEENNPKKAEVETYSTQMAEVLEDGGQGAIKRIIEQEGAYEEAKRKESDASVVNKVYLYGSIFLVLVTIGLVAYVSSNGNINHQVEVVPQFTPIIFNDETSFIEAGKDKKAIAKDFDTEIKNSDLPQGGVLGVYLLQNEKIIGLSSLLPLLEANISMGNPPIFGEDYLLGAVREDTTDRFLLLNVRSFTDVFNHMREWEKKMFSDLREVFGIELNASNSNLLTKNFEDGIVENKNARILRDDAGNIALMYVFIDNNYVVISRSEDAVGEIIARLVSNQTKK